MGIDKKISELDLAQNLTLQDFMPIVNDGDTKKVSLQLLKSFLAAGGTAPSIVQTESYQEFLQYVQESSLVSGQIYAVPYQCVHQIPGTSMLNIDSPQYIEKIETFIVQAISNNAINPCVISLQHPSDEIIWDIQSNTAEDYITARSGKVLYRHDIEQNLSAYFDFRATYFRRGYVDTDNMQHYIQQEWQKNDIVEESGIVFRAKRAYEGGVDLKYDNWQRMAHSNSYSSRWLWSEVTSLCGADIPRKNSFDTLCFINSQNIAIGKTTANNGLNNIVFDNCNNIHIGNNSCDAHFCYCNNITINDSVITSNFESVKSLSADTVINSTFLRCQSLILRNPACDSFTDIECLNLGENSSGDNFDACKKLSVLHGSTDNSYTFVNNTTIGNDAAHNYLRGIEECEIKNKLQYNVLHGVFNSTIGNNVSNCNYDSVEGNYDYTQWEDVVIEDGCKCIEGKLGTRVKHTTFGAGTETIIVSSGSIIENTIFGSSCNDITLNQGTIMDCSFGSSCRHIHLNSGARIINSTIRAGLNTLTMESGSSIEQTTIGAECQNIILRMAGHIIDSFLGTSCANIVLNGGCYIIFSKLEGHNDEIVLESGVDFRDVIISYNTGHKIFSSNNGGDIIGCKTISDNSDSIIYGRNSNIQEERNAKDSVFENVGSEIDFATLRTRNIKLTASNSIMLTIRRMEVNVPVLVLLHNDKDTECVFEIGGNYGNDVKLQLSVATQTKALYEIMRVKVGDIDKIIQIRDAVIL
ncbi:MAG: hypothetical protein IK117_07370 [Bacteroidales bacterium]|nr:hypothetical protein [Bacteroidales bacterium]